MELEQYLSDTLKQQRMRGWEVSWMLLPSASQTPNWQRTMTTTADLLTTPTFRRLHQAIWTSRVLESTNNLAQPHQNTASRLHHLSRKMSKLLQIKWVIICFTQRQFCCKGTREEKQAINKKWRWLNLEGSIQGERAPGWCRTLEC